jgi:long-subunit acyl-CoA synthetase (AMP-forming)
VSSRPRHELIKDRAHGPGDVVPHAAVGQGWGLTESTACGTMPDRALGTVPGSAGRLMPNTELRVIDPETGLDVAEGADGELLIRGP